MSRTTSEPMPCSWCSDGSAHERLVGGGGGPPGVRRRWPASRGGVTVASSGRVRLEPQLEKTELPQLVTPERGQFPIGIGQKFLHILGAEEPAFPGGLGGQRVADEVQDLALEVGDGRHR